ncbi:MAG: hypothetical protein KDC05_14730 [Bacteroidales bacterium]|nr:hypothetical protein [Bacteroidales bacterium]
METALQNIALAQAWEVYNERIFPIQYLIWLIAVFTVLFLLLKKGNNKNTITVVLGAFWLWSGIFFHILIVTDFAKAGYWFGTIFILQGLFFFYEALFRNRFTYEKLQHPRHVAGYSIILTSLIIYPFWGLVAGREISQVLLPGLPAPTAIFTFGILLLSSQKFPLYLLVIPAFIALSGLWRAFEIKHYEDILLFASGAVTVSWLLRRRKYDKVKNAPLE